jgi:hypothetical protein
VILNSGRYIVTSLLVSQPMDRHKTKEAYELGPPTAIQGNTNLLFASFFSISGHFILMLSIGIKFRRLGIFLEKFEDLN